MRQRPLPTDEVTRNAAQGFAPSRTADRVDRPTDAQLRETLLSRFADEDLDVIDLEVNVTGGEVSMVGGVTGLAALRRADAIARELDGVVAVHNRLTVSAGTS